MEVLQIQLFDFANESLESLEIMAKEISSEGALQAKKTNVSTYRSFLGGRAALNHLLQRNKLGLQVLPHPEFGFLQLTSKSGEISKNWFCNLSHTESFAVAAISSSPVGVDIEKKDRPVQKVLSRIVNESELKEFDASDFQMKKCLTDPHLLLWTGKEAFSKAFGLGIRRGLKDFYIDWKNEQPLSGTTPFTGPLFLKNPAISFSFQKSFLVSVCFERDLSPFYFS